MNIPSPVTSAFRLPTRPAPSQSKAQQPRRVDSSSSDSSTSSQVTALSVDRKPEALGRQGEQQSRRNSHQTGNAYGTGGGTGLQNFSRPNTTRSQINDQAARSKSPQVASGRNQQHQTPQHAQGFFEPSLPTTSSNHPYTANLTASQIAAQAAMQHQSSQQHLRKRSQTVPNPQSPLDGSAGSSRGNPPSPVQIGSGPVYGPASGGLRGPHHQNGSVSAASAASAAYPRNALASPGLSSPDRAAPGSDVDPKQKAERSKIKLFSKPRNIGISRDKDLDKKDKAMTSPNKIGVYGPGPFPRMANASTTSLADSTASGAPPSIYGNANPSTTTLVPSTDASAASEKPKHHFLSRQKHKLRDKDDHHNLPLSSAASNSRPLDPSAPQSLYSFTPSSPSYTTTTFAKTVSGLDLRHGGRALREKKREEKASAAATAAIASSAGLSLREDDPSSQGGEWPGSLNLGSGQGALFPGGPKSTSISLGSGFGSSTNDTLGQINLQAIGLAGMTPDDAWPFLKAKLLNLFEGEDLRLPVEDLNKLVLVHIQRFIQARAPHLILEDLHDLLHTGFSSLNHTLRRDSEQRLIPSLVDLWLGVFGTILPYLQAVFLPLDLEFKGSGSIMGAREAQTFWGALPDGGANIPLGDVLDVRRIVLVAFRDSIILSRHDTLQAVFSRLSLESINGFSEALGDDANANPGDRPGTAASLDPGFSSYNSQGSTLLNEPGASLGARSRATSNTSSALGGPSFSSVSDPVPSPSGHIASAPQPRHPMSAPADSTSSVRVTETVGRMLQCVSVLASIKSGDEAQRKMEGLAKTLKHNWLGRGRTGRNRRGFVGTKLRGLDVRAGSPTPTPSTVTEGVRRDSML